MYKVRYAASFQKDVERCKRKGLDLECLWSVVEVLASEGTLSAEHNPHELTEEYAGYWECHIDSDWLLIWRQDNNQLTLLLTNTGTHQELFK